VDHVITLSADQERAVAALVAQAQDAKLTVDGLLKKLIDATLLGSVAKLLKAEAVSIADIYVTTDVPTRAQLLDIANKAPKETAEAKI
jgi:hypothetical protein